MKYDITDAIMSLKPGAEWVLRGTEYSGLEWTDSSQTKPTETEINSKISSLDSAEAMKLLRVERDIRIAKTDWRASVDLTLTDAWQTYRQALRDFTTQTPKLASNAGGKRATCAGQITISLAAGGIVVPGCQSHDSSFLQNPANFWYGYLIG